MRIASALLFSFISVVGTAACGPTQPTGAGGTGGVGGTGGSGGSTGAPCLTKGSQVVVIGDSYMTVNTAYTYTQQLARTAGAPQPYRSYAVAGTSMGNGQIPAQLTQAIAADRDIKVVIMDGGGNDVLIGHRECLAVGSASNAGCQQVVQAAVNAATQLMDTAANAGIRDVVYFFYPHVLPGLFGGAAPNEMLDYSLPRAKASCDGASARTSGRLRCHFIDLVPLFAGHADYIGGDGIHPTPAGAQVIGTAIWNTMKANCIGQAAASACCQ